MIVYTYEHKNFTRDLLFGCLTYLTPLISTPNDCGICKDQHSSHSALSIHSLGTILQLYRLR